MLIDRVVSSIWRLKRAIRVERDFLQTEYDDNQKEEIKDDRVWSHIVNRELGIRNTWLNLIRYETAIERQLYKALHELMRLQSARKGEKQPLPLAIDMDVSKE